MTERAKLPRGRKFSRMSEEGSSGLYGGNTPHWTIKPQLRYINRKLRDQLVLATFGLSVSSRNELYLILKAQRAKLNQLRITGHDDNCITPYRQKKVCPPKAEADFLANLK